MVNRTRVEGGEFQLFLRAAVSHCNPCCCESLADCTEQGSHDELRIVDVRSPRHSPCHTTQPQPSTLGSDQPFISYHACLRTKVDQPAQISPRFCSWKIMPRDRSSRTRQGLFWRYYTCFRVKSAVSQGVNSRCPTR